MHDDIGCFREVDISARSVMTSNSARTKHELDPDHASGAACGVRRDLFEVQASTRLFAEKKAGNGTNGCALKGGRDHVGHGRLDSCELSLSEHLAGIKFRENSSQVAARTTCFAIPGLARQNERCYVVPTLAMSSVGGDSAARAEIAEEIVPFITIRGQVSERGHLQARMRSHRQKTALL
jgi:hypothetical protein